MNWKLILLILLIVVLVIGTALGIYYGVRKYNDKKVAEKVDSLKSYKTEANRFCLEVGRDTWHNWGAKIANINTLADAMTAQWLADRKILPATISSIKSAMSDCASAVDWARTPDTSSPGYNQTVQDEWNQFIALTDSMNASVSTWS